MNLTIRFYKSNSFKVLLLLCSSICIFSCKKYVDIKQNNAESRLITANDCQLLLNDYANMNIGYPSDGESSADNFYLNEPSYLSQSIEERDIYTWQSSAIRNNASPQWQYAYKVVYLSNLVLETLDKIKTNTDQTLYNDLRGQALFFRAYCFWNIAQLYAKRYTTSDANQNLGIPLRLNSDINDKSERGTVQQTYSKIIVDLIEAASLLSQTSTVPSRPNKVAAYAMLARVYLSMEDYPSALNNADAALKLNNQLLDYNTLSRTSTTPFTRFHKEVIFHSIMTPGSTLNPGSATSNIAKIDDDLYNSYNVDDLRKYIFFKENSQTTQLKNPLFLTTPGALEFVTVTLANGTYRFTGNYEPVTTAALFNGLAVDELYLIRAECYARAGNKDASMADLNSLLVNRWVVGKFVGKLAINANDALSQVLLERRKELVMRGQRWTDARRLSLNFTRQIKTVNFSGFANAPIREVVTSNTFNLSANDPRFTLLIPNDVILNSSIQQNPR